MAIAEAHPRPKMPPMTATTTAPLLVYVEGRPTAWLLGDRVRPFIAGGEGDEAGGGGAEGEASGEGEAEGTETETEKGSESTAKKVEMTQAELDALIAKASGRAAKDTEKRLADEAKKASLSEVEKLQAEKAEAQQAAATATEKANARLATAELKVEASGLGVKPDRLDAFLRIAGIDGLEVDDDGKVTGAKKLAADTLKAFPEFKATATNGAGRAGGRHNGDQPEGRAANLEDAVSARLAG